MYEIRPVYAFATYPHANAKRVVVGSKTKDNRLKVIWRSKRVRLEAIFFDVYSRSSFSFR